MKIAIIGGGISGLATAFYIRQLRPEADLSLFEREPEPGGTMYTRNVGGYRFEIGSNGFLSNKPDTLELVKAAGADHLLLRSNDTARIRYIFTDRLHRLPESPPAFITSKLLSLGAKLRVAGEILVPRKRNEDDETLQSFGYRRVGKAFTDIFLDAMSAGIYASTPAVISVNAAFPAVVRLEREYGGLFKGMLKKRRKEAGPGGVLMSFKGGVGTFVDFLAARLDAPLYTSTQVTAVSRDGAGYALSAGAHSTTVDTVILATPAYVSARLLRDVDADLAHQLEQIEYSPVAVIGLGYDDLSHPLDGFGLLTTSSAGKQILGVLWDSSIFPDRAPPGKKAVRVMIGGQRNPSLALKDDPELVDIAVRGVRETMGVTEQPSVTFVKRWERGIPNYSLGHLARVDGIFRMLERHPGLYLSSNAYYGIGLNDCVANARRCAEKVVGHPV